MDKPLMGRMLLWATALGDCEQCLDLAAKLDRFEGVPGMTQQDAQIASRHLISVSIVYFCQLYNKGFEAPQSVAAQKEAREALTKVEAIAFPDPASLSRYRTLKELLMQLRDQTIAHADGPAFSVTHDSGGSASAATPLFPPERYVEFRQATGQLLIAVMRHASRQW